MLDVLSRTPGVGQAFLFGAQNYSMRVWMNTDRLTQLGLSPTDIITAIQAQNTQAAIGTIGAKPIGPDQQFQLNIQTQGRLVTPKQFGNIILRANQDGSPFSGSGMWRGLELGAESQSTQDQLDGAPALGIGIYLEPGANAVETSQRVKAVIAGIAKRFPPGLSGQRDLRYQRLRERHAARGRPRPSPRPSCWWCSSCSCSSAATCGRRSSLQSRCR